LQAHCAKDAALDKHLEIARFQIDIFGKVPHQPLTHALEVSSGGRKTKLQRIVLLAGDKPVAQAQVLRVRRMDTPVFAVPHDYPAPETIPV
jgi:hypothetical protein